jgi:hypothetical protein
MVKQRTVGSDHMEDPSDPSSPFLDALRTRAMDDLHVAALEYGILLKDLGKSHAFSHLDLWLMFSLAVIDRQFKGDIAATMDKLTTRALQAQVEAANVDRENSNKVKQEQGALQVAQVKAQARKVSCIITIPVYTPSNRPFHFRLKPRHSHSQPSQPQRPKQRHSLSQRKPKLARPSSRLKQRPKPLHRAPTQIRASVTALPARWRCVGWTWSVYVRLGRARCLYHVRQVEFRVGGRSEAR